MTSPNYDWELSPGEHEVERARAAGHVETRGYVAGGRLLLTNARLIWIPSRFARRVSSSVELELELSEISEVDIAPRPVWPFIGGMRRRMRVRMLDGTEHQFMITTGRTAPYVIQLQALAEDATARNASETVAD